MCGSVNSTLLDTKVNFSGSVERSTGQVAGFLPRSGNVNLNWRFHRFSSRFTVNRDVKATSPPVTTITARTTRAARCPWLSQLLPTVNELRPAPGRYQAKDQAEACDPKQGGPDGARGGREAGVRREARPGDARGGLAAWGRGAAPGWRPGVGGSRSARASDAGTG